MNYRRFITSSNINFAVNDHLVECGTTTWQIRNIAATSVGKKIIPFKEPEPTFSIPEPQLEIRFFTTAITATISWLISNSLSDSKNIATLVAIGIIALFIYTANETLTARKKDWLSEKNKIETKWKIWDEMRRNPPILYSLMLETNAGSKPLFYSLDEEQITKANTAIKRSMEKKESGDIKFDIETVNIGSEESINNFGSSIYNQSIQGV